MIIAIVAVMIGLSLGAVSGYFGLKFISSKRLVNARIDASKILEESEDEKRMILLEAKEDALRIKSAGEDELRGRRSEIQGMQKRISNREENVERRASNLERREKDLGNKEKVAEQVRVEVDASKAEMQRHLESVKQKSIEHLETIASLSISDAKEQLMRVAEEDIQSEVMRRYHEEEEIAKQNAGEKAKRVLSVAIQRMAAEVVADVTVTSVPLPSDDMKGRLIGREGRNIRAIEKATGVDLIIDDTPEAVTLSCFDPVRREIARIAVGNLVVDGRIHPARIEEMVLKAEKEVDKSIVKSGEEAVLDTEVRGLHPEIIKLLGRLKYRYSYGENVLQHSLEVAHIAGMIAAEIGADVSISKSGGLLHDIGKALTHEVEGPHAEIGANVANKYNVSSAVHTCIAEHHNDDMSSTEAFIVAAADAISAARPGARRDTVENYIKRLEALEQVGNAFEGVEKCFAIQAGREVRIMVEPEAIDDVAASKMARDIVKKIEDTLVYPGQIKVIVIRESRVIEFAR
jgi:ribonuclease Y